MELLVKKGSKIPPSRVVIDAATPSVGGGRYAAKCMSGAMQTVEAVILCDGHEILKADLLYRYETEKEFHRVRMKNTGNDGYSARFHAEKTGRYFYTVEAAIDRYAGWRDGFLKKVRAGEAEGADAAFGLELMGRTEEANSFRAYIRTRDVFGPEDEAALERILPDNPLRDDWSDPSTVRFAPALVLIVDPAYATCGAWYEFFPRSRWTGVAESGTLRDAIDRLPYIADLGFDIVYLPPIHPIGRTMRKGRNNALDAEEDDAGSPWAIGGPEGGHKSIHPDLGDFDDFDALCRAVNERGMRLAMDIAFQCSPDHPYVAAHPEWFRKRMDGTIQYAENPPKKYQDIYPFDFECAAWPSLWEELKSVIQFWIDRRVRVFRVDNPHTKSFAFWEWAIADIRGRHPDVIFLAEAFTRPHVMAYLAKIGFNQSYTYFTWRNTRADIEDYLVTLTRTALKDYFRPNFWPNTPDILTEELQSGKQAVFMKRLILAATLSASYGIYGPPFELMESVPVKPGKEEYLHSEKYEARTWDVGQARSLSRLIRRVNRIRRDHAALQNNYSLLFHPADNQSLLAYSKHAENGDLILTVVNLDPDHVQSGFVDFQIQAVGIPPGKPYVVHDLLTGARYEWTGWKNYVSLDPRGVPAHIFSVEIPV